MGVLLEKYIILSKYLNILSWLAMVILTILSSSSKFNEQTNKSVSDTNKTFFTPASYAFVIWGLIYATLGIFCLFQFIGGEDKQKIPPRVNALFEFNLLCNGVWNIAFAFKIFWLTLLIIFFLAISLLGIYIDLRIGKNLIKPWPRQNAKEAFQLVNERRFYWCAMFPFSLYLGWTAAAIIANLFVFFCNEPISWYAGAEEASIVLQCIAGVLGILMILLQNDVTFAGVIAWALISLGVEQRKIERVSICGYVVGALMWFFVALGILYNLYLMTNKGNRRNNYDDKKTESKVELKTQTDVSQYKATDQNKSYLPVQGQNPEVDRPNI